MRQFGELWPTNELIEQAKVGQQVRQVAGNKLRNLLWLKLETTKTNSGASS